MDNKLIIATAFTPNYAKKARAFVASVEENSRHENILILTWQTSDITNKRTEWKELCRTAARHKTFKFRFLNYDNVNSKNSIRCLQNGEFVNALRPRDIIDDPIIIFCDSDVIMQREVSQAELSILSSMRLGDVMLGINETPGESMEQEASKLGADHEFVQSIKESILPFKVYNTGLIAARSSTFRMIKDQYYKHAPRFLGKFKHYAQLQWVICFAIQASKSFRIIEMDSSFHSHCHRPSREPNPGTIGDTNGFIMNEKTGKPVLFNHRYGCDYIQDKTINTAVRYVVNDFRDTYKC
jgi:hypothetical protein